MKKQPSDNKGGLARKATAFLAAFSLRRLAGALCRAGGSAEAAADEILYGLPGVFAMSIEAPGAVLRLIKEAGTFRIMKKAEKSELLLRIRFEDLSVLGDVVGRECTMQRALSEGRLTFAGKTKYLAAVMRASAAGDKALLPNEDYYQLYGKKREE